MVKYWTILKVLNISIQTIQLCLNSTIAKNCWHVTYIAIKNWQTGGQTPKAIIINIVWSLPKSTSIYHRTPTSQHLQTHWLQLCGIMDRILYTHQQDYISESNIGCSYDLNCQLSRLNDNFNRSFGLHSLSNIPSPAWKWPSLLDGLRKEKDLN